jgi:hypothetical protein
MSSANEFFSTKDYARNLPSALAIKKRADLHCPIDLQQVKIMFQDEGGGNAMRSEKYRKGGAIKAIIDQNH